MCLNRIARMALDGGQARGASIRSMPSATTFTLRMWLLRDCLAAARAGGLSLTAPTTFAPAVQPRASGEMVGWAAEKSAWLLAPRIVPPEQADILQDPTLKDGNVGVLTMFRASAARPAGSRGRLRAALHAYMDWMAAERGLQPVTGTKMIPQ